jgi:hypothetical protein
MRTHVRKMRLGNLKTQFLKICQASEYNVQYVTRSEKPSHFSGELVSRMETIGNIPIVSILETSSP